MSLTKPTVNIGAKNPQLAVIGHLLALIGGIVAVVFGILGLLDGNILGGIIAVLMAVLIVVVELDRVSIPFLKDPLVRGIAWIIIAVVSSLAGPLTGIAIAVAGILYIIYHFS